MSASTLFLLQRLTALVMIPFVLVHLGLMIYAVQDGLSAAEILGRTRGSVGWAMFYGTFVVAVSIHATIGLRTIAGEWLGWRGRSRDLAAVLVAAGLAVLGLRAVIAVVA